MCKPNLIHEKGTKVVGLNCNPLQPDLLLSIGNDHFDSTKSLVVIGRYISKNYYGDALHPIDFINISTGQLVAELMDPNVTTISPVNKLHPREDIPMVVQGLRSWTSHNLEAREKRMLLCWEVSKKLIKKHGNNSDDDYDNDILRSKDNGLE
ncbi:protein DAMAGED DNA-BINDING 2-like isoform X2 [Capsicum galapagoense]